MIQNGTGMGEKRSVKKFVSIYDNFLFMNQLIPARALRMLIQDEAPVMIESMWEAKMKLVSVVTPSMLCLFSRGRRDDIFNMAGMKICYTIFSHNLFISLF